MWSICSCKMTNYYLEEMLKQNLTKLETKEICGKEFSYSKKLARELKILKLGGDRILKMLILRCMLAIAPATAKEISC